MAHGTPDWWDTAPQDTVHRVQDMAELAVRLDSPVTYKRTGNVIYVDDFDEGLVAWSVGNTDAGNNPRIVTWPGLFGGYSAEFTTGAGTDATSYLVRMIPGPALSIIGCEYTFSPVISVRRMELLVEYHDGSSLYQYWIRYDHVNGDLYLFNDAGGQTLVGSPGVQREAYQNFVSFKMTADLVNTRYDWIYFNEHRYDGTTVTPPSAASSYSPHLLLKIWMTAVDTEAAKAYIDNFVVTQNEPR